MIYILQKSGFFLLEACISIFLIGIFGFLLSTWHVHLSKAESDIRCRVQALTLARSCIEEFKALGRMPTIEKKDGFKVSWEVVPDRQVPHFSHVTVTVSKIIENNRKLFTLKTGILHEKRDKSRWHKSR